MPRCHSLHQWINPREASWKMYKITSETTLRDSYPYIISPAGTRDVPSKSRPPFFSIMVLSLTRRCAMASFNSGLDPELEYRRQLLAAARTGKAAAREELQREYNIMFAFIRPPNETNCITRRFRP